MANAWKWWIVVLTSLDYFTYYEGTEVIKARSAKEAGDKARGTRGWAANTTDVEDVFGPFDKEPRRI